MRAHFLLLSASLLTIASGLRAGESAPTSLLGDREIFPVELFPGVENLDESELILEGLLNRFPDRLLNEPPTTPPETGGEPILRENDEGVAYVRVGNLALALPAIKRALDQPVALVDLRYVRGNLDDAIAFGSLLAGREELVFDLIGDYPEDSSIDLAEQMTIAREGETGHPAIAIVLTNGETSGPIEAVLAELQSHHRIITIGNHSAGATAVFQPVPGYEGWYAINGEIRPASVGSLVGIGLKPSILVTDGQSVEAAAYAGFNPEEPLSAVLDNAVEKERYDEARLIRDFTNAASPSLAPQNAAGETIESPEGIDEGTDEPLPIDQSLRSALYVIEAMRALGRF